MYMLKHIFLCTISTCVSMGLLSIFTPHTSILCKCLKISARKNLHKLESDRRCLQRPGKGSHPGGDQQHLKHEMRNNILT